MFSPNPLRAALALDTAPPPNSYDQSALSELAATMVHELKHINQVPGMPNTQAEDEATEAEINMLCKLAGHEDIEPPDLGQLCAAIAENNEVRKEFYNLPPIICALPPTQGGGGQAQSGPPATRELLLDDRRKWRGTITLIPATNTLKVKIRHIATGITSDIDVDFNNYPAVGLSAVSFTHFSSNYILVSGVGGSGAGALARVDLDLVDSGTATLSSVTRVYEGGVRLEFAEWRDGASPGEYAQPKRSWCPELEEEEQLEALRWQ